jgi:hypothetical protein
MATNDYFDPATGRLKPGYRQGGEGQIEFFQHYYDQDIMQQQADAFKGETDLGQARRVVGGQPGWTSEFNPSRAQLEQSLRRPMYDGDGNLIRIGPQDGEKIGKVLQLMDQYGAQNFQDIPTEVRVQHGLVQQDTGNVFGNFLSSPALWMMVGGAGAMGAFGGAAGAAGGSGAAASGAGTGSTLGGVTGAAGELGVGGAVGGASGFGGTAAASGGAGLSAELAAGAPETAASTLPGEAGYLGGAQPLSATTGATNTLPAQAAGAGGVTATGAYSFPYQNIAGAVLSYLGSKEQGDTAQDLLNQQINSDQWRPQQSRYFEPLYDAATKGIGDTAYGQSIADATARKTASMGMNLSGNQAHEIAQGLHGGTMDYIRSVTPLATGRGESGAYGNFGNSIINSSGSGYDAIGYGIGEIFKGQQPNDGSRNQSLTDLFR